MCNISLSKHNETDVLGHKDFVPGLGKIISPVREKFFSIE
jgi:hypothetical protein